MTKKMKVAIYARVSTSDGRQTVANQLRELRAYAKRMGWKIVHEYLEEASATTGKLPIQQQLFADAALKMFDAVLVFRLDRFCRLGIKHALEQIDRLKKSGVEFWSYKEEHFRTVGKYGEIAVAYAAWQAEMETEARRERINSGIARAREEGIHIGRRRNSSVTKAAIMELRKKQMTVAQICGELNVSRATVYNRMGEARAS